MKRKVLNAHSITSTSTTPLSSAFPSAYPSEDESEDEEAGVKKPTFPFSALPSELRNKIYGLVFSPAPQILDLDPSTFALITRQRLLALFSVCRQIHFEATHHFFSTRTFRLFPTYPGRYFKTKKPLITRLPAHYRASITSLELRLGPGWNNPPRGWVVNDALGLSDCAGVRVLKIFVECDPSDAIFKGFRKGDGFYERFSQGLLDGVLNGVPSIKVVEIDAWSSVKKSGDMVAGLLEVAVDHQKVIAWGPERGWVQDEERNRVPATTVPVKGQVKLLARNVAIVV